MCVLFIADTSHISSAQQPHGSGGYHTRKCSLEHLFVLSCLTDYSLTDYYVGRKSLHFLGVILQEGRERGWGRRRG